MGKVSQKRGRLKKIGIQAIPLILITVLFAFSTLQAIDLKIQDKAYQKLGIIRPDIYVIGIDEETLSALGPFQSWSRENFANIINVLTEDPDTAPAVIGIDVGFYGNKTAQEDDKLAQAAKKAGNVVVTSYASFGKKIVETEKGFYVDTVAKTYEQPYDDLKAVTTNGHSNVEPDIDGVIRHCIFQIDFNGEKKDSFAYAVYKAYTGGETKPPVNSSGQWYLDYAGEPMDYFGSQGEGSSFIKVLTGEYPKEMFAGSIVLIGPYSTGMMDSYRTPVSENSQMNGVEIQANAIQALLDNDYKKEAGKAENLCLLLLMLAIAYVLTEKLDFRISGICLIALTAGYVYGCTRLYEHGYVFSIIYAAAGIWLIYLFRFFYNFVAERLERKKMMDIFSRYLSPQVVKNIAVKGEKSLVLGGEKKDIAVLFVDIRGFTSISERLKPEEVVVFLNNYLSLTASSIFKNDGTVDKFIGDATMAVFNAPFDLDDYVYKAVKTGLDMVEGAKKLEKELTIEEGMKVSFGVGINCGDAIVGNVGTDFRMDYTAIGDTVNTASRIEGQAKGGEVLISEAVYKRLEGRIDAQYLGKRQLKGKQDGFDVYKVNGLQ